MSTGYLDRLYAFSFAELGEPWLLPSSRGWILKRPVSGSPEDRDAMGLYPLFLCQDWNALPGDLEALGTDLISLALVADPFGNYTAEHLQRCFPAVMIPFKQHFVADLSPGRPEIGSRSHRLHARWSLKRVDVELLANPIEHIADWVRLYGVLIDRHQIRGVPAFSRQAFEQQLRVPGLYAFAARHKGEVVGMTLWYQCGEVMYWHLSGFSELGYRLRVSYALLATAIDSFRRAGVRWLNLGAGAGAGTDADPADGLSAFKRGWSNDTRTAWFCGRIFDAERYHRLVTAGNYENTRYFPAYRAGEFGKPSAGLS